jgi:hypothetical protein
MKIKMISLSAVLFFCFSISAFAQANLSSLHASKGNAKSTMRSAIYPMTDIQVLNHSNDPFTVKVPGTPINDILLPGEVEYITSDVYFDAIVIILNDRFGNQFFNDYVPNHSVLEVTSAWVRGKESGKQAKLQAVIKKH